MSRTLANAVFSAISPLRDPSEMFGYNLLTLTFIEAGSAFRNAFLSDEGEDYKMNSGT